MYYPAARNESLHAQTTPRHRHLRDPARRRRRPTRPTSSAWASGCAWGAPAGACRARSLSRASGVSERYLAELERGAGNASLLVLRQIADALSIEAAALVSDEPERPIDLTLAMHQLERLSPAELAEARRLIAQRFGQAGDSTQGRIALVGLRGAGKTTLGQLAAAGAGRAVHGARPRDRAGQRHGAVGDLRRARTGHVPLAGAAVPGDRRRALRAGGDRHRRQPGDGARDLRPAAVDAASSSGSAPRPTSTWAGCWRRATCGRWPTAAGHGRPQGHPGEPHARSTPRPMRR